jgi:putative FmdB family regulatory protein
VPTYDYKCKACGKSFEIFHSMTEKARTKCPACGKNALERQLGTGGAIIFKGSGFYQTDYRSESYKKSAKADSAAGESKSADTKSSESKSSDAPTNATKAGDAKPATKAESSGKGDSKPKKSASGKD